MNHLTAEQIIDFVSLTELNTQAVALCSAVNGHIRKCEKCLEQVRAFQTVHDAFCRRHTGNFKEFVLKNTSAENEKSVSPEAEWLREGIMR